MTDKELAAKARAVVGEVYSDWDFDSQFVRDWRVAGALMEKTLGEVPDFIDIANDLRDVLIDGAESLPRAIIEACVEALS